MSHTPGPWALQECSHGGAILIRGQYGEHHQSHLQIVPVADARLIAAAPELLEALRYVVKVRKLECSTHADGFDDICAYCKIRAAIAKATGGAE
jgi:hypothetical protein